MESFDEQNMYVSINLGDGYPARVRIDSVKTFDFGHLAYYDEPNDREVIVGVVEFSTTDDITTCNLYGLEVGGTYNGGQSVIGERLDGTTPYVVENGVYTFEVIPTPNDPAIKNVMDAYNHIDNFEISSCSQIFYYFNQPPGPDNGV